jgi:hypothetical protein
VSVPEGVRGGWMKRKRKAGTNVVQKSGDQKERRGKEGG